MKISLSAKYSLYSTLALTILAGVGTAFAYVNKWHGSARSPQKITPASDDSLDWLGV